MAKTTFGERLRQARVDAGLTQSDLVRLSGIPKPTLSRYENDHVMPSLATLGKLARALGVAESILLPGKQTPEEELIDALHEHGVEIRTRADARRIANIVADALAAAPAERPVRRQGSAARIADAHRYTRPS